MRSTLLSPLAGAAALLLLAAPNVARTQDEAADAPTLSIEEIIVEPGKPAADTLCKLSIKVKNPGSEVASQFGFGVKLNGQDLGVYGNQLFMFPVEPNAENEIRLYNFWTTETSRPTMPANGKMTVEVALTEARWMKIEDDDEGVEVWTPIGDIENLPVSKTVTLETTK